jgi:DNA-binding XRE family transcriptional regulator
MKKPYIKLRMAILENDVRQEELAKRIDVNPATFSKKINGKAPFLLWDCYTLMDELGIPDEQFGEYFPREFAVPHGSTLAERGAEL